MNPDWPAMQTVIWDFNGTLLNDFDLCLQTINQMLARRQLSVLSQDDYRTFFDFPVIDYYRKLGFDFDAEPFPVLAEEYMTAYQPASFMCPLRDQAREILALLHQRGVRQILLSATKKVFLLEQTSHFGLNCFFEETIGLEDILGASKLEIASSWFDSQNLDPDKTVLIGDTTHDFAVAEALHCSCLLLLGGHNSRVRLEQTSAAILDDLSGIMPLLACTPDLL
jgi:phosphoglycolate phosphatase